MCVRFPQYLLVIFCLLLPSFYCLAQNRLLQGEVTEQNTGRPLPGIELASFGAKDISDDFGVFQLVFPQKKPGDKIDLWVSDPQGRMMVVNRKQVEALRLPYRADEGLRIVMANQAEYFEAQQRFYGIILENSRASAAAQREQLYAELKQANQSLAEYERLMQRIKQLETDTRQIEQRAEELATYLASIDLSQASELQQEALAYVKRGLVDSALWALDEQRLEAAYVEAARQKAQAQQGIEQIIGSYALQAEIYQSRGAVDTAASRWLRIAELREESLPEDKTPLALAYIRAGYLRWQGSDVRQGRDWISRGAEQLDEPGLDQDSAYAAARLELASVWQALDQGKLAQTCFLAGLAWQKQHLGPEHPQVAHTQQQLGLLKLKAEDYSQAISHLSEAMHALRPLQPSYVAELYQAETSLAFAHYKRGLSLQQEGDFDAALGHFTQALELVPDQWEYRRERGRCHRYLDQFADALADFQWVAERDSAYQSQAYHSDCGILALRKGQWEEAEVAFQTFVKNGGSAAQATYHEALKFAYPKKHKKALEALEKARAMGVNDLIELRFDPKLEKLRRTAGYRRLMGEP